MSIRPTLSFTVPGSWMRILSVFDSRAGFKLLCDVSYTSVTLISSHTSSGIGLFLSESESHCYEGQNLTVKTWMLGGLKK